MADTIVLKNGRRIKAEKVWEDGGQIKGAVYGATIGYPKDQVKSIERDKNIQNDVKEMLGFDVWTLGMDIAVATTGDDATLKRFTRMGENVILLSENPAFDPIMLSNGQVNILGITVGVVKQC